MPIMVDRAKWILYKHTSDIEIIKQVAINIKYEVGTKIDDSERHKILEHLSDVGLYKTRNPEDKPLDSINHRINTLEYFMFGYEYNQDKQKRFMFSPLGNLFMKYIEDDSKITKIFTTMLFGMQFQHPANGTPEQFQLYPFRLIFSLLLEERLDYTLYNDEYAYIIAFVEKIDQISYSRLVDKILEFRNKTKSEKIDLFKSDEHTYVNCVYEWQYYMLRTLKSFKILDIVEGDKILDLYHPKKTNSQSPATKRTLKNGYVSICRNLRSFVSNMLQEFAFDETPIPLNDPERLQIDAVKEIYSFYPKLLLKELGEQTDSVEQKLLELPQLIEKYSQNPENQTAYLFEDVLEEGFNMFYNVDAKKIGGAGHTDIECIYNRKLDTKKKFAVEAKSTENKLLLINSGRLRRHRDAIGGEYTIVITPRYVPAAIRDISDQPVVVILAHTFSEYLYNHLCHNIREIDYKDFDDIIVNHLGEDVSRLISQMTISKFASTPVA